MKKRNLLFIILIPILIILSILAFLYYTYYVDKTYEEVPFVEVSKENNLPLSNEQANTSAKFEIKLFKSFSNNNTSKGISTCTIKNYPYDTYIEGNTTVKNNVIQIKLDSPKQEVMPSDSLMPIDKPLCYSYFFEDTDLENNKTVTIEYQSDKDEYNLLTEKSDLTGEYSLKLESVTNNFTTLTEAVLTP